MQPELSLQYNSSAGNGWLGQGWDLSVGAIQRSTKDGRPSYNDQSDTFLFISKGQSQELVRIPDGSYRAKIEGAFQKFEKLNDTWLVWDKSGNRFLLGNTPSSKITTGGGTFLWAMTQVIDRNGNTMTISYTEHQKTLYLAEILYTSNLITNRPFDRKVRLSCENRPDVTTNYRSGEEQRMERRLQKVETFVYRNGTWELVKTYQFIYAVGNGRLKSELTSIQLSGHQGTIPISLPASTFQYGSAQTSWDIQPSTSVFQLPDSFIVTDTINPSLPSNPVSKTRDNGLRFVELNGDGRIDLIQSIMGYAPYFPEKRRAWLNTPSGWQDANQWAPSEFFTIVSWWPSGLWRWSNDNGVRFVDLNGDGLTDMIMAISIDHVVQKRVFLNTGTGWSSDQSQWHLPYVDGRYLSFSFGGTTPTETWVRDNGVQFADLNGDGRVDLVQSLFEEGVNIVKKHVWLNTGNGWSSEQTGWNLPEYTAIVMPGGSAARPNGTILTDLNGDGLTDLGLDIAFPNVGPRARKIYLNTGSGFVEKTSEWGGGLPEPLTIAGPNGQVRDNGIEFSDLNGDGLVDFVQSIADAHGGFERRIRLNTGSGWTDVTNSWPTLPNFSVMNDPMNGFHYYTTGFTFADVNADSVPDMIQSWRVQNTQTTHKSVRLGRVEPHAVKRTVNSIGGLTDLEYDFTPRLTAGNHKIPFPMTVLTRMTQNDGSGTSVPIHYSYFGGLYEPGEREFLGFARVETTDAVGHTSKSYFLQNLDPQGQPAPGNAFKGRVTKTEQYHLNQQLLRSEETHWQKTEPWPGVHFVRPEWVQSTIHDGGAPTSTKVSTFYDDIPFGPGYGNVLATYNWGDVLVSGDEQTRVTEYAENVSLYLLSFPKRSLVLGPQFETLSDTHMLYDGFTTPGQIFKGNVTRLSTWLDKPTAKWITTNSLYNDYGQVTDVTDPYNHRTRSTYNAQGFPDTVTNVLNHTVSSTYDMATGNVLTETNINQRVTTYVYDALGRETKVVGPLDSLALPSSETFYNDNLLGQPNNQFVETRVREEHGQAGTLWSKNYFDGLGRTFKQEQEDVNGGWTVSETQFNNRGLAERVSVPRRNNASGAVQWTWTTYDALGRTKEILKPDNSLTQHAYYGRISFVQDANGKIQSSEVDAYGQVILRSEPGVATPTRYEYTPSGNLARLTDSQGKMSTFEYDTLGRKLLMNDPNAGKWRYRYDDRGLLTEQTDARGATVEFKYDALGRLKKKISQESGKILAQYTYDEVDPVLRPYSLGKLTTLEDASGVSLFSHDALGRVNRDVKQVDTLFYDTRTQYDAMGRVKEISYPSNRVVKYFYNTAGQLDRVTDGAQTTVYASYPTYNDLGQMLEMGQSNQALKTTYTYHPLKHVLGSIKTERFSPATTLQHMGYGFDSVGNLQTITDYVNSSRNQTFGYDDLYRLTSAQGAYGHELNTYDQLGNFRTKNGKTYFYENPAHPYAVTRILSSSAPATDASTVLAWNLDRSEPIYFLSGTVSKNGHGVQGAPVLLNGLFGEGVLTDINLQSSANGYFRFQGVPGRSKEWDGGNGAYSLSVSSVGMLSKPSGYTLQPLSQNRENLNFVLYPDTSPVLNPALLRTPRMAVAFGAAQGAYSAGAYSGGLIGGLNFGGQVQFGANGWTGLTGYSPLPDGADTVFHSSGQYIPPPGALAQGVVGPSFITGQYQDALFFNGLTDVFVFPGSREMTPNRLTIMLWVNPSSAPSFGYATLLAKSTATAVGGVRDGFRLLMNSSRQVVLELGASGGSHVLTTASALPLGDWTFVTATYDGAQTKIYFNTALVATGNTAVNLTANNASVTIGASMDSNQHMVAGTFFRGAIDEPRVQSRAWSAGEIGATYTSYSQFATFTYDANGNCLSKTVGPITTSYQYDDEGRLVRIQENGVTRAQFVYDAAGNRVKKITTPAGSASQTTVYIGKHFEVRPGTLVDHIFSGGQLVADVLNNLGVGLQTNYYQTDHLGSTTLVADAAGGVLQELSYAPFGKIQAVSGQSPLKHKYTQQEDDESTGLYFYNARYYDPVIGRFTSADSLVPSPMDPQSLNRYAYVRNNPTVYSDPSGHSFWREVGLAIANPMTIGLKVDSYSVSSIWNANKNFLISAGLAYITSGGNPISAAAAYSSGRFMGSSIGKRITSDAAKFLDKNGVGTRDANFWAHFAVETGVSLGVEHSLASLNGGLSNNRAYDNAKDGYLLDSGGDYAGRSTNAIAIEANRGTAIDTTIRTIEASNGNKAVVATGPFGNTEFASKIEVMHTSVASPALQSARGFGGSNYLYRGSCHQFANNNLLHAGFGATTVGTFGAGWTRHLSNSIYGIYGGQLYPKLFGAFRTSQGE